MDNIQPAKGRVAMLDELRGILIIYVVVYHLLYDLTVLFPLGLDWMFSTWNNNIRDFMTGSLIVISGISGHYSKSNLRRGMKTFGWAMVLSVVTLIAIPSQFIAFGILHFFGVSMMLYHLLAKPLARVPTLPGVLLSFLLFFFTKRLYYGSVGLLGFELAVPAFFYDKIFLWPLGFRCAGISSADYYPLFPWFFLFLAGGFLGRWVKAGKFPRWFYKSHSPALSWVGSRTLVIYLLHQPLIYGALYVIFALS